MLSAGFVVDIYNLVLVACLAWFSNVGDIDKSKKSVALNKLLIFYSIVVCLDALSRVQSEPFSFLYILQVGSYFLVTIMEPFLVCYCFYYIETWVAVDWSMAKPWVCGFIGFALVNLFVCTIDQLFGLGILYQVGINGYVQHGILYNVRQGIILVSYPLLELYIHKSKYRINKQFRQILRVFPLVPFTLGVFQIFDIEIKTLYIGLIIGFLLLYIFLQVKATAEDALTGVANRRKFDTALEERIGLSTSGGTFSMIMIDVDYFKTINDKYGHDEGDIALVTVANLVQDCLRKDNDLFARYGGDEFCVLLNIENDKDLMTVVKRIYDKVFNYNQTSGKPYNLSLSMGYSVYDVNRGLNCTEFIHYIDELMYEEKSKRHQKLKDEGIEGVRESGLTGILDKFN